MRAVVAAAIALLGAGWLPSGEASVPAGASVAEVPPSIDATGTADVTEDLNAFVARLRDGQIVRFQPDGRYRVNGTLVIDGRSDLVVEGNGATLLAGTEGDRSRNHLTLQGVDRVTVRDLAIEGAHPSGGVSEGAWRSDRAFQHGIRIVGSRDVELDHVRVTDVFGDFVYVGSGPDGVWSERIWIHDSEFARNGRQGIAVTAGRGVVIEDNSISATRRATVDLEPNTPEEGVEDVHLLDNRVGPGRLRFVAAHGEGPVNRVVIEGNVLSGRDLAIDVASAGDRRREFWILGNSSDVEAATTPIQFVRVDGVVVRDNVQAMRDGGEAAVRLSDVCGSAVQDNDFGGAPSVTRSGATCAVPPPREPPARPKIAAPDFSRYAPVTTPASTAASTSVVPSTTAAAPAPGPEPSTPGAGDDDLVLPAAAVGAVAALVVAALVGSRKRRSRTRGVDRAGSG